jgi:hypothetical protein
VRYSKVSTAFKINILVEFKTTMAAARIRLISIAIAVLELILRKCYENTGWATKKVARLPFAFAFGYCINFCIYAMLCYGPGLLFRVPFCI